MRRRIKQWLGYGWATPVPRRYAFCLSILWYAQRYTPWRATYHRVWAAATAVKSDLVTA